MRELTRQEVGSVNGGINLEQGMGLISGITGLTAVLGVAPAAAAFGAGVLLIYSVSRAMT